MADYDPATRIYTPAEWNTLPDEARKRATAGAFGRLFRNMAATL